MRNTEAGSIAVYRLRKEVAGMKKFMKSMKKFFKTMKKLAK